MTFVELPLSNETTSGTDNTMTPSGGGKTPKQTDNQKTHTNLNYYERRIAPLEELPTFFCDRNILSIGTSNVSLIKLVHMINSKKTTAYFKATKQLKRRSK